MDMVFGLSWYRYVKWVLQSCKKSFKMCVDLRPRPAVTLCGCHDVKIQLLTPVLLLTNQLDGESLQLKVSRNIRIVPRTGLCFRHLSSLGVKRLLVKQSLLGLGVKRLLGKETLFGLGAKRLLGKESLFGLGAKRLLGKESVWPWSKETIG